MVGVACTVASIIVFAMACALDSIMVAVASMSGMGSLSPHDIAASVVALTPKLLWLQVSDFIA